MHSTNYRNTLILPAEDCKTVAKIPDKAGSVADLQFKRMIDHPYEATSDDVLCGVAADRQGISPSDLDAFRAAYFAKGQPCFRASPLTKTHGWAVHSDGNGRVALIDPDSSACASLQDDEDVKVVAAMRNKRA